MQSKYLEKLEYNKILEMLKSFCVTYIGKELALNLKPESDKEQVSFSLKETTESYMLIHQKGNIPIFPIDNISLHLTMLSNNATLSIKALLELYKILKLSRELKEYFSLYKDTISVDFSKVLSKYFYNLYKNTNIEKEIESCIIDENTLDDKASANLSKIRRNQRKTEQEIRDKLNSFTRSKYVQEALVTIRNDRFVIPVKQEYRSQVNGFVHDISASGATVFIEPMVIFELNNELNSLKLQENIEIEKILKRLSTLFYTIKNELEFNLELIGKIDFAFAKAKFAISLNATEPNINTEKYIDLISARHPLIDSNKVVPIDINIGKSFNTLVVTGPNTGGKTVTLKTVGLLTLMAMSGLYIPASEKSSIYVFDNVFADIGDDQSIFESLSTFSSHMTNIIEIINTATSESLVLLDELGSGTDPIEGANLAISILDYLFDKNILTISTTHYPEIKSYVLTKKGFENASSDFDVENLKPTYKLLIGVPGKSNAFEISKKLGLKEEILNNAKKLCNTSSVNIEELLKNIYNTKLKIENEKVEIENNLKEVETLKKLLQKDNTALKEQEQQIIANAKIEANNILIEAKQQADEIIKELSSNSVNLKKANRARNKLNEKIKYQKSKEIYTETINPNEIKIGLDVFIPSLNQNGTILSLPNKDNIVQIQIGNIKTNIKLSKLSKSNSTNEITKQNTSKKATSMLKAVNIPSEINVIGYNVEEAISVIDKYIDNCILANIPSARIIHGKGTGALKKGIHQYLSNNPYVKSFRLGNYGEGDLGVTVIEF